MHNPAKYVLRWRATLRAKHGTIRDTVGIWYSRRLKMGYLYDWAPSISHELNGPRAP